MARTPRNPSSDAPEVIAMSAVLATLITYGFSLAAQFRSTIGRITPSSKNMSWMESSLEAAQSNKPEPKNRAVDGEDAVDLSGHRLPGLA